MLIRIVRMTFKTSEVDTFLAMFDGTKQKIRNFKGCQHLTLLRDAHHGNIFMTYSIWENEAALEQYRHSDLFKSTWKKTKQWFADKPLAYSAFEEVTV